MEVDLEVEFGPPMDRYRNRYSPAPLSCQIDMDTLVPSFKMTVNLEDLLGRPGQYDEFNST
jgi:hypothetical protein